VAPPGVAPTAHRSKPQAVAREVTRRASVVGSCGLDQAFGFQALDEVVAGGHAQLAATSLAGAVGPPRSMAPGCVARSQRRSSCMRDCRPLDRL